MELERGVFFEHYGQLTYLRHTAQRKDYTFSGSAGDFLDYVRSNPGCNISELCDALAIEYELNDRVEFDSDMVKFKQVLTQIGVLKAKRKSVVSVNLHDQVRQLAMQEEQLFAVTLEITYRCDERCIHCYVDDEIDANQELTLNEYRKLLDELRELGCLNVLFTGGEVTIRKDFLDIVEYAVHKGFCVDVYTNGLALTQHHIERLVQLGINSVSFSLYGPDARTHDSITLIPGSLERTLKSMLLCKCAGLDTYVKTVVMKQNFDTLEELMRLGKLMGICINTSMIVTASHAGRSADDFRLMDAAKYQRVMELSLEYDMVEDQGVGVNGREPCLCGIGKSSLSIDPYGNVMPCNAFHESMGNIRMQPLQEIRENAPLQKKLSRLTFKTACPKSIECPDAYWCAICPGSSYSETGEWTPTPDVCLMARGTHNANVTIAKRLEVK